MECAVNSHNKVDWNMTDVDGALKELVRVLRDRNILTDEEVKKIRSRYHSAKTYSSTDPI